MASSDSLTAEQRSLRARLGALAIHSAGKTNTAPASAAFLKRFEDEVDPERTLPPEERRRRAEFARRRHMTELAFKSSVARSRKRAA